MGRQSTDCLWLSQPSLTKECMPNFLPNHARGADLLVHVGAFESFLQERHCFDLA
jgi:hypothetical protein